MLHADATDSKPHEILKIVADWIDAQGEQLEGTLIDHVVECLERGPGDIPKRVRLGWDHIRVTPDLLTELDGVTARIARQLGITDQHQIAKVVDESRDELGTMMDRFLEFKDIPTHG
jgi:hypothetical protein